MSRRITAVLSGGGVKAAAHLGAIRALREAGLAPTRYLATSMGAVFAALLAEGLTPEAVLARVRGVRRRDVARLRAAPLVQGLWTTALMNPEPLQRTIGGLVSAKTFSELTFPLTVTATDLDSSEVVVFGDGGEDAPLQDALVASCALPPWYPPVTIGERRLADGGLRGVLPLSIAARFQADLVIAVDAGPGTDAVPASGRLAPPPFVRSFTEVMHVMMSANTELALALWRAEPGLPRLLYIRPETERGATFALGQFGHYDQAGHEAAVAAIRDQAI
ncbi:MAG TPA: patatin-like phospholipase family protein [Gemmatimonadales bacterium]|nr:patatin-like phospholipase family protein [Gemmatimonadales bacterium]